MRTTSLRSRLTVLAVAAAVLGAVLPATAGAAVRPTVLSGWTVAEGQTAKLRVKLTCQRGYGTCTYRVDTFSGTARRPDDFTAKTSPGRTKLKVRRAGHSMVATVAFTAVADGLCEGTETARVRVIKRTTRQGVGTDYGTVTITDPDCDAPPAPSPQPAPAPTPTPTPDVPLPPDSGSPTVTTTNLTDGVLGECVTPQWIGTAAAGGSFNSGCAVKVACPPTARVCSARAESRHTLERAIDGERVSLNSRITTFSASDTAFFGRDQSSANTGFTRNEDSVMIRGGESARIECNGVRIAPTAPNRSQVGCSLTVERVS
jgi:hypothetical protein